MAERHGVRPRPRILVKQYEDDLEALLLVDAIRAMGIETVALLDGSPYLPDWDCVVDIGTNTRFVAPHLRTLSIGGHIFTAERVYPSPPIRFTRRHGATAASELAIPDGLPSAIASLVRSELIPGYLQSARKHYLIGDDNVDPFLLAGAGGEFVLAGRLLATDDTPEQWILPEWSDPVAWLRVALQTWSEVDPERFPPTPEWWRTAQWMTHAESVSAAQVELTRTKAKEAMKKIETAVVAAEKESEATQEEADLTDRVLLTGQGSNLVAAVIDVFQRLGFSVQDMDEVNPEGGKLEDLRITLPGNDDWIAIAEVKGYKGGAKTTDLTTIGFRFAKRFAQESGRYPDAQWYVVNRFLNEPPDSRQRVLASNDEDVAEFAEEGGLVVDTVDLFRLINVVEAGQVGRAEARTSLIGQTGRYVLAKSALEGNRASESEQDEEE